LGYRWENYVPDDRRLLLHTKGYDIFSPCSSLECGTAFRGGSFPGTVDVVVAGDRINATIITQDNRRTADALASFSG
jgi:hypothetical protein